MSDNSRIGFWVVGTGAARRVKMTKLYNVWASMRSRCLNKNHHAYDGYGGRGITICAEWESFQTFYDWATTHGYAPGLYLDRERNGEGYLPGNCRWVTAADSVRNRRTSKVTPERAAAIRGASGTHVQIASEFGLSREHVRDIRNGKRWKELA